MKRIIDEMATRLNQTFQFILISDGTAHST